MIKSSNQTLSKSIKSSSAAQQSISLTELLNSIVTESKIVPSSSSDLGSPNREAKSVMTDLLKQPSILTLMKSMFGIGKTYRFRLVRTAILTTSGTGTLQLSTGIYPSQHSEYSALSSLFSESRLKSSKITYAFYGNIASNVAIASAFDMSGNGSATPNFTFTISHRGFKLWPLNQVDSKERVNVYNANLERPWGDIASTGSVTDPTSANRGCWLHSLSGLGPLSTDVGIYVIESDYQFRNPL